MQISSLVLVLVCVVKDQSTKGADLLLFIYVFFFFCISAIPLRSPVRMISSIKARERMGVCVKGVFEGWTHRGEIYSNSTVQGLES